MVWGEKNAGGGWTQGVRVNALRFPPVAKDVSGNRWFWVRTANLAVEMAVGSQLSVTVSEGDL